MDERLFDYAVANDCINVKKILLRCENVNINRQHIDHQNCTALMIACKSMLYISIIYIYIYRLLYNCITYPTYRLHIFILLLELVNHCTIA